MFVISLWISYTLRLSSGGSSYSQTLSTLGLLLCCVYTGEEGESLIGVTMDTTAQARERITCILEWWVCYGSCDYFVVSNNIFISFSVYQQVSQNLSDHVCLVLMSQDVAGVMCYLCRWCTYFIILLIIP